MDPEWVMLLLAGGGAGSYAVWKLRARRDERRERAVALEGVRKLADEDVTIFGEQLTRLGTDLAERSLDQETRHDYQAALDAYERAKFTAPRLGSTEELSTIIDTLATGRYSLACVRARVANQPLPELRVPCFFNPQHGPSSRDVMYTVPRRGTQRLPACVMCATRVKQKEKPEIRTVQIGDRKVPYWEAGEAYLPYSRGYFPADSSVAVITWGFADMAVGGHHGSGAGDPSGGGIGDYGIGDFDGTGGLGGLGDFGGGGQ
ncbi:hypothetical protein [Nocardioides sp.]|uniref:hypothetical protein n=1 Tax=Nocardioides sp. TaxID=35761 RepID=UPI002ED22CC0